MSELIKPENTGTVCPKRPWIMSTLADDERLEPFGVLPRPVQFHIARCASCQALADELLPAIRSLDEIRRSEPPKELLAAAQAQAAAAIERGAELTGRVDIPDTDDTCMPQRPVRMPAQWIRYAAAAVLAIGFTSFWIARHTAPQFPLVSGGDSWIAPQPPVDATVEVSGKVVSRPKVDLAAEGPPDDPKLASSTGEDESTVQHRRRRICDQQAYDESTLLGDGDCIPRILVRPDTRQRNIGWGGIFDPPTPNGPETRLLGNDTKPNR